MTVRAYSSVAATILALVVVACGSGEPPRRNDATTPPATAPGSASQPAAQQPASEPAAQPPAPASRSKDKVAYAGELPPLPASNFLPARPPEMVRAVYEFAARRPDVLRYVPCFCGCERNGHVHNEHCFVSGREPDGKPRWDAHGMS